MKRSILFSSIVLASALAVSACGDRDSTSENADDYAARINGQQQAGANGSSTASPGEEGTPKAPKIATPKPGAAPGPYEAGTQTDPKTASCGAPAAASAIGKRYEDAAATLQAAVVSGGRLRAVAPGAAISADHDPKRLNAMLDASRIVRDLRCG